MRRSPGPRRAILLAGAVALATALLRPLGCATAGLPLDEVIQAPIAVLYWEEDEARRRRDLLEQAKLPPGALESSGVEGVATVEGLERLVGVERASATELVARLGQWPGHLSLVDPRTGEVTRVEAAAPGARPLAWSADHRELLFASDRIAGTWQLYAFEHETGEVRTITDDDESHFVGDWSRDGRLLYNGLARRGKGYLARVYLTGPHGVDPRPVLEGASTEVRFTPDGEHMLLVRPDPRGGSRPRPPFLVERSLVDPDAEERLVARGRGVSVSANGEWVVYSGAVGDGWRLVRIRPNGAGRSPIGRNNRDENMPSISPDARHVVYVATEGEFDRLFICRLDGSGDRVLLDDGSVAWPVW